MDAAQIIKDFPYVYIGGGYFRQKDVPKGVRAKLIHGGEIIKELAAFACPAAYKAGYEEGYSQGKDDV